jgi:hypothetical protein
MSDTDSRKPKLTTRSTTPRKLDEEKRSAVTAMVARLGLLAASEALGVHAQTVARLAAGFDGHRSVVALVEHRLAALLALQPSPQDAAGEPDQAASQKDEADAQKGGG